MLAPLVSYYVYLTNVEQSVTGILCVYYIRIILESFSEGI